MAEVISLRFDAVTNALLVELDAVDPATGGVLVGAPRPIVRLEIEALDVDVQTKWSELLAAIESRSRSAHAALAQDPKALAEAASVLAVKEEEHAVRARALDAQAKAIEKASRKLPP